MIVLIHPLADYSLIKENESNTKIQCSTLQFVCKIIVKFYEFDRGTV